MKISLVGLGGCGKTSLYSVAFAEKNPEETKSLSPTILYETRRHPFLGLQVGIFDFGGQEQYRKEYMDKPEVFRGTDILINHTFSVPFPNITIQALSNFTPIAPPVQQVYYQVDTWTGQWQAATPAGISWTATLPALQNGLHVLYAYAADGQDATSINTGSGSSPILPGRAFRIFQRPPSTPIGRRRPDIRA